jgi:quinol monooxygenase YgiN
MRGATSTCESRRKKVVIVTGSYEFEPGQRDEYLASRHDSMRASRTEPGCFEFLLSADPIEPDRVVLFERWADQASLDAHIAALPAPSVGLAPKSVTVTLYDVAGERRLRG